jgi:uncharacterized membrane protein
MNDKTFWLTVWLSLIVYLVVLGGLGFIAWHFISKFW